MSKREIGDLFEVFSDPRPSGASAMRGKKDMGDGFRKFLEERGEYPFKDDGSAGKFRFGRMFRVRSETLLVVALAFLIANIASFSLGVWNGKRGVAVASEPEASEPAAMKLGDVAPPKVVTEPVPPAALRRAREQDPKPANEPAPAAPAVEEAHYTIRVVSLGLSKTKDAQEIAAYFKKLGYNPAIAHKSGKVLVVDVGAFASTKSPEAVRSIRDVRNARFNHNDFKTAYFVSK